MKIDTQEVVNLIKNVIRNPLRSLLMKIEKNVCICRRFSLFSTYRDTVNPFG